MMRLINAERFFDLYNTLQVIVMEFSRKLDTLVTKKLYLD